jgi:hypothetical protein
MSKSNLSNLNDTLADVIQRLMEGNDPSVDPKDTISIERAKAINNVASTMVQAAKVQADVLNTIIKHGGKDSMNKASLFFSENDVKKIA